MKADAAIREMGLTLIEVLVALAIFTVVAAAVLAMFPTIFKVNGQTRAEQAVTIGAKQYMEQVRARMDTRAEFDAPVLPAAPTASQVNNYTCTPTLSNQTSDTAGVVVIKRMTLACTHSTYVKQTFSLDLGRPL
ncbi:type IV pilus modification PilV family protein [Deinococcus ficus]|uniref:type IV pilus modification PilV family protein n=1 Tax=Deinococcus ficus TaxID=317577 RepID=UPI00174C1F63|nr:type II secretion system protein [Deinococcus ficus]GHF89458.1 hypothetical protein GCM10017782_28210 [Deinococcus ficus]